MSTISKYNKISSTVFKTIIKEKKAAVLVFGADWSGNTSIMDSMMERISKKIDSQVIFYKVDVERNQEISAFFGVTTVPTTVMLKDGEVIDMFKGFLPAKKMQDKIRKTYNT